MNRAFAGLLAILALWASPASAATYVLHLTGVITEQALPDPTYIGLSVGSIVLVSAVADDRHVRFEDGHFVFSAWRPELNSHGFFSPTPLPTSGAQHFRIEAGPYIWGASGDHNDGFFGEPSIAFSLGQILTLNAYKLYGPAGAMMSGQFFGGINETPEDFNIRTASDYTYIYSPGFNGRWLLDSSSVEIIGMPVGPSVPEPATWWMMILGIGLLGAALRRRGSQASRRDDIETVLGS